MPIWFFPGLLVVLLIGVILLVVGMLRMVKADVDSFLNAFDTYAQPVPLPSYGYFLAEAKGQVQAKGRLTRNWRS